MDEFTELCTLTGTPTDEVAPRWQAYQEAMTGSDEGSDDDFSFDDIQFDDDDGADYSGSEGGSDDITAGMTPKQLAAFQSLYDQVGGMRNFLGQVATEKTSADVKKILDSDPKLGTLADSQKEVLAEALGTEAARYLQEHPGTTYGPAALNHGLAAVREQADKLGLVQTSEKAKQANQITAELRDAGIGLGPSEGGAGTSVNLEEPPQRPSGDSDDYEDYFVKSTLIEDAQGKFDSKKE